MKTKLCKSCKKEIPKWLLSACSPKCQEKLKKEKEKEKKKIMKEKKAVSISVLTMKADKIFGEYIRTRDSLKTTGTKDKCVCITCGETVWNIQCGHFITRSAKSTRWEEKNAHWQCPKCNCWWAGRQYEHGKAIDRMYWEWTANLILRLSNEPEKLTAEFIKEIIRKYEEKLEN